MRSDIPPDSRGEAFPPAEGFPPTSGSARPRPISIRPLSATLPERSNTGTKIAAGLVLGTAALAMVFIVLGSRTTPKAAPEPPRAEAPDPPKPPEPPPPASTAAVEPAPPPTPSASVAAREVAAPKAAARAPAAARPLTRPAKTAAALPSGNPPAEDDDLAKL